MEPKPVIPHLRNAGLMVTILFLAIAPVFPESVRENSRNTPLVWVEGKSVTMPLDEWERLNLGGKLDASGCKSANTDAHGSHVPPPVELLGIWDLSRTDLFEEILEKRKVGSWHSMPRITVRVGEAGLLLIVSEMDYPSVDPEPLSRSCGGVNTVAKTTIIQKEPSLEVVHAIDVHVRQIIRDSNKPNAKPAIELDLGHHDFAQDTKGFVMKGVSKDWDGNLNKKSSSTNTTVRLQNGQAVVLRGLKTEVVEGQPTKWEQDPKRALIVFLSARVVSHE